MESCSITACCLVVRMSRALGFVEPVVKSLRPMAVIPPHRVVSRIMSLTFSSYAYYHIAVAELTADEKVNASLVSLPEASRLPYEPDLVEQVSDICAHICIKVDRVSDQSLHTITCPTQPTQILGRQR